MGRDVAQAGLPAPLTNPGPETNTSAVHPVTLAAVSLLLAFATGARDLPRVTVTHDDTVVGESCEIVIAPGTVIADANTNGVLHITADNITVRFAPGSELRGADTSTPWDHLRGIGIRIDHHRGVRIVGATVHGFFNGLVATHTDKLAIEGGDFSDNYRQHLRSTSLAEDGSDWLFPHHNDEQKWRDEYGGAICVESAREVIIRNVIVRRGQNGIVLDRVNNSRIYDNDCSFLSGWGLALWRSSRNVVSRNAFDFCVRGHVEGVYNRGQDSAGILCFEQSSDNIIAENSATHGGDGFFGFAGREALGEFWMDAERERLRRETGKQDVDSLIHVPPAVARDFSERGCNRNLLLGNDFSYAPAHGIEMTFSEGNIFARNRLVENAICGVWGGYSSGTVIAGNDFTGNGGMAYGLERGAINMEHASGNRILDNQFINNKCGIHLWWDNDGALLKSPGVAGNDRGVSGNIIARNTVRIGPDHPFTNLKPRDTLVFLQIRDDGTNHVRDNVYLRGKTDLSLPAAAEFAVKPGCEPVVTGSVPSYRIPSPRLPGAYHPVGARPQLRGRDQIILDDWGPWDHVSPLFRSVPTSQPGERAFEALGVTAAPRVDVKAGAITSAITAIPERPNAWRVALQAPAGVTTYSAQVSADGLVRMVAGTLVSARWDCVFFPWTPANDPRTNLVAWRSLASSDSAVRITVNALDFPHGMGGPRDLNLGGDMKRRGPGPDHFGMIAKTHFRLPRGTWKFHTLSDDGVRVAVDGKTVLENWNWHGPTPNDERFIQAADAEIEVVVEHFEIDGYSTLEFSLGPEDPAH